MTALKYLDEFQTLLQNYTISNATKVVLRQTDLLLLVAPTSSGRNTIIRELIKTGNYHYIVSDTTRKPRINDGILEKNGREYWFRTEEQVLADLRAGRFIEAAIIHNQQVSGISVRELETAHRQGKIGVTDIEIVGVQTIVRIKPDTKAVFVLPPNFEEWQRRIKHRGKMSSQELYRRMQSAYREFMAALEHNYYLFVINDNLLAAVEQINHIARFGQQLPEQQAKGRQLAEQLLIETKSFLQSIEI